LFAVAQRQLTMKKLNFLPIAFLTLTLPAFGAVDLSKLPPASKRTDVTFEKDIKPLFEASCIRCHGEQRPKAGLRLDSREGVLKGTKDGAVVVPGKSAESDLVIAVSRLDEETAMPPTRRQGGKGGKGGGPGGPQGSNTNNAGGPGGPPGGKKGFGAPPKPLTPEQVGLVRAWVDQGAK
jgi:hypothetical protein